MKKVCKSKNPHYTTPGSHNLRIPSREEFQHFCSNLLNEKDFSTVYPAGYQAARVKNALDWTIRNGGHHE